MGDQNCDIWSEVDFGEGPVRIRCTQPGRHIMHRCEVFFKAEPAENPPGEVRHNVFEKTDN